MDVQSCCNSFAYLTNCFFDVLVVVAVVASYTQSLVSCSALFKAFLDLTLCKWRIWCLESGKFLLVESRIRGILLVESGILGFRIQNTAQEPGIALNRTWNPESKFRWQRRESSTWNPESAAWIPESKTVSDSLTLDDRPYIIKKKRRTIAIKEHKIGKPNEKGIICERNWTECNGQAKTCISPVLIKLYF